MDDELRIVRETLQAAPPDAAATFRARNRLTDAMRTDEPGTRPRSWTRRRLLIGGVALAGVAGVVLAGTLAGPPDPTTPPTAGPAPTAMSARSLLLAAADRASTTAEAGSGRYWHVRTVDATGPVRVGTAAEPYDLVTRWAGENWIAREPGAASWQGSRRLGYRPRTAADERTWRRAGSPRAWDLGSGADRNRITADAGSVQWGPIDLADPYFPGLGGLDFAAVRRLPADPAALRAFFLARIDAGRAAKTDRDGQLFEAMNELMVHLPTPPKVRAAAVAVLAGIPGARDAGEARDALGRTGVRIEWAEQRDGFTTRSWLVVDPATHLVLATGRSSGPATSDRPVKELNRTVVVAEWSDGPPAPPAS